MEANKKCPKCGGEMEKGKMIASGFAGELVWIKEGKHLKIGAPKIIGYSCPKCKFIENYLDKYL